MLHLRLLVLCICGMLLLTQTGQALNLAQNPGFETAPPADPNFVAANWSFTATNATGVVNVSQLAGGGQGGSKSLHLATTGAVGDSSSSNGAWQIIPVVIGAKYQIHGKWRGDVATQLTAGSVSTAEVYVGFGSSATVRAANYTTIYQKRNQYASTNIFNVDPNFTTGACTWDWQELSASPNMGYSNGDTITATNSYMTIRFNMSTTNQTGTEYVDVDNVVVQGCQTAIGVSDINGDCVVNMRDMALIANNWLTCGVTPSTVCW